jgi:hypothetical protein
MPKTAVWWAFHHHYHSDKSNAAVHLSAVRFSPLTFRLADAVRESEWWCVHISEVLADKGKYSEDRGRAADDDRAEESFGELEHGLDPGRPPR